MPYALPKSAEADLCRQVGEACVPAFGNCRSRWAVFSCGGESGIQREPAACHEDGQHDGNSSHYRLFLGASLRFPIEGSSSAIVMTFVGLDASPEDPSSWYFATVKQKGLPGPSSGLSPQTGRRGSERSALAATQSEAECRPLQATRRPLRDLGRCVH